MAVISSGLDAGKPNYDPRWFIWTIVFLVVTGISLVSYIVLSDTSVSDSQPFTTPHHARVIPK